MSDQLAIDTLYSVNIVCAIVTEDPEGQQFPWAPKSTCELLQGKLVGKDGKECTFADVKGKIVGLYFSAHWVSAAL